MRMIAMTVLLGAAPAAAAALPPDVAKFVARRDRCDHFRGEAGEDPGRGAEIGRALSANCRGTDAALARLLRRHAADTAIRMLLERYDPRVEPASMMRAR